MKTFSGLALGFLLTLTLVPQLGAAPQFGSRDRGQNRDRVCVYQDIRFQGWEQCYNAGDEIPSFDRRNNAISSIRVYGRARVTVYEDTEFRGRSAEFDSDVPDLGLRNLQGSKSWSDHIQSMRVSDNGNGFGNNRFPDNRFPDRRQLNQGFCIYDRPDYEGREQCWESAADLNDLARSGAGNWSDRISSIRVFGRTNLVLFRDIGFRGDSVAINSDVPDLSRIPGRGFRNWDRQASSIEVDRGNGRFGRRFVR